VAKTIQRGKEKGNKHSIIILAEGVMRGNELAAQLAEIDNYHARVTVLGHVQRGGSPSAKDRVLASKFGARAVEVLQNGQSGMFLGLVNNAVKVQKIEETLASESHHPKLSLYQLNQEISN